MRNLRIRYALTSVVCAAVLAVPSVFAQSAEPPPSDPPPAKTFQELDANGDGAVSVDEAVADEALSKDFARRDANADGKLSEAEFNGEDAPPAEQSAEPSEKKDS